MAISNNYVCLPEGTLLQLIRALPDRWLEYCLPLKKWVILRVQLFLAYDCRYICCFFSGLINKSPTSSPFLWANLMKTIPKRKVYGKGLWHCPHWFFWLVLDLPLWKIWKSMGRIIPCIMENKNVWNHQAVLMYCIIRPWHVRSFTRKLLGHWDCIVPSTRAEPPADNGHHVGGIHDIMLIFQGIHGNPWPWVSEYMTWCPYFLYDMYDCISISHSIAMMFGVHSSFKKSMCGTCSM